MAELTGRFKAEAQERAAAIGQLLDELGVEGEGSAAYDTIRDHAHKIKGAAGVFGFDDLKARAATLEEAAAAEAQIDEMKGAASGLFAALPE